jgi:hypothetical protein
MFLRESVTRRGGKTYRYWSNPFVLAPVRDCGSWPTKEENWVVIRKDADDRPAIEVQEIGKDGPDRLILARSAGCAQKERGIHDRVLARLKEDLEAIRKTVSSGKLKDAEKIHKRLGRLQERHGSLWKWVSVQVSSGSNGQLPGLTWQVNADVEPAMRLAEGVYLLRTNLPKRSPKELWGD